jgi:hypothetical protein
VCSRVPFRAATVRGPILDAAACSDDAPEGAQPFRESRPRLEGPDAGTPQPSKQPIRQAFSQALQLERAFLDRDFTRLIAQFARCRMQSLW